MASLMKILSGKKTYLGMIGWGVLGMLWSQGMVDDKVATTVGSILTAWTGIALRSAWTKKG